MTSRLSSILALTTALSGSLLLGGAASAQTSVPPDVQAQPRAETPAQTRSRAATSSLNSGPADTVMQPRSNAQPPLSDAERPTPARPVLAPPPASAPAPTRVPTSSQIAPSRPAPGASQAVRPTPVATPNQVETPAQPAAPSLTLKPGATSPDPIAMPLGYYVKSPKACNEVWPGEGDLAWFTPTAFTIDFGGCEPGQFMQTGLNAWSEEQKCMTELGGDAGGYSVTYEVTAPGEVHRIATLEIDGHVEEDVWKHCEAAEVPEEARFKD